MTEVRRPALRWHGGKWMLAPWILSHFPVHRTYVEPFGGAASVLLRKQRSYAEVYNDLDDDVVTLFRVLQNDEQAERLIDRLVMTPFARTEFEVAWEQDDEPVEQARRLIIRSFMGFGSNAHNLDLGAKATGFRADSNKSGSTPARDWARYPMALRAIAERFRGVVIESRSALEILCKHDGPEVLHYVDPPYMPETRGLKNRYDPKHRYRHELSPDDHVELLHLLRSLEGMVVLSGYPHRVYDEILPDFVRVEKQTFADGAQPRTEVLWLNPKCADRAAQERSHREIPLLAGRA